MKHAHNFKDRTGNKYGKLTVLSMVDVKTCLCKCACGTIKQIRTVSLRAGNSKSCGCRRAESCRERTKHGLAKRGSMSAAYVSWRGMIRRCYTIGSKDWAYYGGRGIIVATPWHKVENFIADMGEPPLGFTLDRIDNNGNYEPRNCKWSSRKEQANNRRDYPTIRVPRRSNRMAL